MTSSGDDEAAEGGRGGPEAGEERGPGEAHASADHPEAPGEPLETLRARILELDASLVRLVGERRRLVREIGRVKEAAGKPVMDPEREARVVRRAARIAREEGVDEEMVRDILWRIIASAREAQEGRTSWGPPDLP